MRFRKLRIAWSVFWGLACVLLVVLWVRSYWWVEQDLVRVSPSWYVAFGFAPGDLRIGTSTQANMTSGFRITQPAEKWLDAVATSGQHHSRIWGQFHFETTFFVLPFWFLVVLSMTAAVIPWLRWRFTIRTLLIATTLVAVVLGLAVYAGSK